MAKYFWNRYIVLLFVFLLMVGLVSYFGQPKQVVKVQPIATTTTPTALPSVATAQPTPKLREGTVQLVSDDYMLQLINWGLGVYAKGCQEIFDANQPSEYVPGCILMGSTFATNNLLHYVLWGKKHLTTPVPESPFCRTKYYGTLQTAYFILHLKKYGIDNSHGGCDYSPLMISVQTAHGFYSWTIDSNFSNLLEMLI